MMATFDLSKYVPIVGKAELTFIKPATTALTAELKLSAQRVAEEVQQLADNNKVQFCTSTELLDENSVIFVVSTARYYLVSHEPLAP